MSSETDKAFEEIALPHMDSVFRAAVAICGDDQLAEDLTQTAYLKALEGFASFQQGTNCKAWLLTILRHAWIDRVRRRKVSGTEVNLDARPPVAAASEEETRWSDAEDLLDNFSDEQVIRAMRRLPEEQRLTLYLIDVEEMSYAEVAGITDVPVGTVKSRTSHARSALKEKLGAHARELGFQGRRQNAPER